MLRVVAGPLLNRFAARTNLLIVIGGAALGLILLAVSIGPLVMQTDAFAFERGKELLPPSSDHWFGTDRFGRDFFARVLEGGRVSLTAAFVAMSLILAIGITLGTIAGYLGSWVDGAVMRIVDVLLALPPFVAAIAIAGLFGTGLQIILIGVVTLWWAWYARITRGIVLQVKERLHVDAAKGLRSDDIFDRVSRNRAPCSRAGDRGCNARSGQPDSHDSRPVVSRTRRTAA